MTINRHGETFDERPPHGEYWLCPLHDCKYKLLVGDVETRRPPLGLLEVHASLFGDPMAAWTAGADPYRRDVDECDRLMREHLKTHEMHEFARTVERIQSNARAEAQRISKLVSLVFYATATQEPPAKGGK